MTEERWDVPSERLKRIAGATSAPQFRECPRCPHRHPKAERCGYPVEQAPVARVCECVS